MSRVALADPASEVTRWIAPEIARHRLTRGLVAHHLKLDESDADERIIAAHLHPDDVAAAERLVNADDRRRLRRARAALRALLSAYTNVSPSELDLARTPEGKPYLADMGGSLSFNMSSSSEAMLVALAPAGDIGADVEPLARAVNIERLAPSVLTTDEQAWLDQLASARRQAAFLKIWTIKEAVVKANGAGLRIPVTTITSPLTLREGTSDHGEVRLGDACYTVTDTSIDSRAAAVAYRS